jgi:bifunctional DNA-binding transcriptional regulator/antitoxin component of YhaV-PrlF toxin-antitoxin module
MPWEISISADGWTEIREKLEVWNRDELIAAITDDKFEMVMDKAGQHHAERAAEAERNRLKDLPHDLLADRAYELIEQNNSCDNGGWAYWIDREGYHKVWMN